MRERVPQDIARRHLDYARFCVVQEIDPSPTYMQLGMARELPIKNVDRHMASFIERSQPPERDTENTA